MTQASVLFADANTLPFPSGSFDVALCGFMGWDDCFDFDRGTFTQPDRKAPEIWRVLRPSGRFVCCSWEVQEGVTWMEAAITRHYPAIMEDEGYLAERPVGMAYENSPGYRTILESAGFQEITVAKERVTCITADGETWWQQMLHLGWEPFIDRIEEREPEELARVKEAVLADLQPYKHPDGIRFDKLVLFVQGVKG